MSGDSWDVSVDVQEASIARSQLDFLKTVDLCLCAGIKETDINEEVCKKKWKTLRYRKEKQNEKEAKRSGAGSSGGYKPWANSQQAEAGETGQEEASVVFRRKRAREMSSFEQSLLSAVGPILAMPPPPPPPVVVEEEEDLLFFRSLLPTMRLMSRAKRLRVRFAIHKVVLEADQEDN